jgi:hypothetical protein
MAPSLPTVKRLFALSDNHCAFPGCASALVEPSGTVTGRICHVRSASAKGSRYDPSQTDKDRDGFENLILLCGMHHDVIDKNEAAYTVDVLLGMKREHERKGRLEITPQDEMFARILLNACRPIEINNTQGPVIVNSPNAVGVVHHQYNIRARGRTIKVTPPPDAIANDAKMRGYVKYLIDRYKKFASQQPARKTQFQHPVIYSRIEDRFGIKWDLVPQARFQELIAFLTDKIDQTFLARVNRGKGYPAYTPFDDWCKEKFPS